MQNLLFYPFYVTLWHHTIFTKFFLSHFVLPPEIYISEQNFQFITIVIVLKWYGWQRLDALSFICFLSV